MTVYYTAAYRDQHGEIRSSGMPDTRLDVVEAHVRDANIDDPGVRLFVAYRTKPEWRELT